MKNEDLTMRKTAMMNKTKKICLLGIGIALYVALSATIKIPLIGHIQTDLGYIAFGAFCVWLGWGGMLVGTIGCIIESLLFSGWFPVGWAVGQMLIGFICGMTYTKLKSSNNAKKYIISGIVTIISVFIGIVVIKSGIECIMFEIPLEVKIPKSITAFVADTIPMILGTTIGYKLDKKLLSEKEKSNE